MNDAADGHNVIAVSFEDDSNAYRALTTLGELGSQSRVKIEGAAVVVRGEDGRLEVKDQAAGGSWSGSATGGVIGLLIGVLAGPLGILIGGATGLLIGSLFDDEDTEQTTTVLGEISTAARPGRATLLAEVVEQSPEVIDSEMAGLGGTVMRRPVAEVEAELAAAEEAQRKAKREARKELAQARHAQHSDAIQAKIAALKAKLPGHA